METSQTTQPQSQNGYTVETIAVPVTPEAYKNLSDAQKAKIDPALRAQLEAALNRAAQIPQNPNHDQAFVPPDITDALGVAKDTFEKMSWKEKCAVRRRTDELIGRRWYQLWQVDLKNQNDLAMILAGMVIGIIIGAGVVWLLLRKD